MVQPAPQARPTLTATAEIRIMDLDHARATAHRERRVVGPNTAKSAQQLDVRCAYRLKSALLTQVGANALLDLLAEIGVDVVPVLEDPRQHRLCDALGDVSNDVVGQAFPGRVVENLTDHGARLAPVVVLGVQR